MMTWKKTTTNFPPGEYMFGSEQPVFVSGKYRIGKQHMYAYAVMIGESVLYRGRFPREFKTLKEAKAFCEEYENNNDGHDPKNYNKGEKL